MAQRNKPREDSVRVTIRMPQNVHNRLKYRASLEGCSVSWLLTELAMHYLHVTQESVDAHRGYTLPKRFNDRKKEEKS